MTRDAARVVLAAYPNTHGAPKYLPPTDTDRALRATIRHGIRQYSWSIISVITAELPSCERCGLVIALAELMPSVVLNERAEEDDREHTPATHPDDFTKVKGAKAKTKNNIGEVWAWTCFTKIIMRYIRIKKIMRKVK